MHTGMYTLILPVNTYMQHESDWYSIMSTFQTYLSKFHLLWNCILFQRTAKAHNPLHVINQETKIKRQITCSYTMQENQYKKKYKKSAIWQKNKHQLNCFVMSSSQNTGNSWADLFPLPFCICLHEQYSTAPLYLVLTESNDYIPL